MEGYGVYGTTKMIQLNFFLNLIWYLAVVGNPRISMLYVLRCFSAYHGCKEQLFELALPSCQLEPVNMPFFPPTHCDHVLGFRCTCVVNQTDNERSSEMIFFACTVMAWLDTIQKQLISSYCCTKDSVFGKRSTQKCKSCPPPQQLYRCELWNPFVSLRCNTQMPHHWLLSMSEGTATIYRPYHLAAW